MPAAKPKKKALGQGSTLHDFFPGFPPTPAGASKKSSTLRADKTPIRTPRPKAPRATPRAPVAGDAIIIISDNEDASDARQNLKREVDDGDVLVLDDTPPKAKRVCRSSPSGMASTQGDSQTQFLDHDDGGFGQPSALLRVLPPVHSTPPAIRTASGSRTLLPPTSIGPAPTSPIDLSHGLGAPSSLLCQTPIPTDVLPSLMQAAAPTQPTPALPDTCTPPHPPLVADSVLQVAVDSQDTLWQDGDDEIMDGEVSVNTSVTLDDSIRFDQHLCPVCNVNLSEDRDVAEGHVLECIEALGVSDTPEPTLTGTCLAASTSASTSKATKTSGSGNAFSVLMSSFKETEAWKEAGVAEDKDFRPTKENGGRRKAPFYKVLQGMPIAVDAFRYGAIPGVNAYFLTHAHSDHYTNLSSKWKNGPIYCSEGTANLIIHILSVDPKWVHPLPMDVATEIPNTGGVRVTPIEANHCPGSALFLFEGQQTTHAGDSAYKSPHVNSTRVFRYLHCGDFRASPQHVLHPAMVAKKIDTVYLDTTYLDPKYCFPPQPMVISACAELAQKLISSNVVNSNGNSAVDSFFAPAKQEADAKPTKRNPVVVVGTYSIGKERIVKAVAQALNTTVYCDARKAAILRCQQDPELHAMLSNDPYASRVHLVPLGVVSSDRLKGYVDRWKGHYTHAIAFRPTGWTYAPPAGSDTLPTLAAVLAKARAKTYAASDMRPMRNSTRELQLYGVPYSEHSSFAELTCFALSFDWGRMIATVNVGSESSRKKMGRWIEKWETERKMGDGKVVPYRQSDYW